MVLEALEWGMGCPFADERHDLATPGVSLYADGNGRGTGTRRHCSPLVAAVCRLLLL